MRQNRIVVALRIIRRGYVSAEEVGGSSRREGVTKVILIMKETIWKQSSKVLLACFERSSTLPRYIPPNQTLASVMVSGGPAGNTDGTLARDE